MAGIAIDLGGGLVPVHEAVGRGLAGEVANAFASHGYRKNLHQSSFAQVEDWFVSPGTPPRSNYEPGFQLVLTYLGLAGYCVGQRKWLIDCNQSLLIPPGLRSFNINEACAGYAAILVKPSLGLLEQLSSTLGSTELRIFTNRAIAASMRLRLLTHLLRVGGPVEPLQIEECMIEAFLSAADVPAKAPTRCSTAVDRTKELLHARAGERLNLDEIAIEVGLNSIYLTQEFTRCEGVPLYRYQLQLRLTRALLELPECDDITGLALDLGFSSHSHFTCAFRKAFGTTPSQYRVAIGGRIGATDEAAQQRSRHRSEPTPPGAPTR